MNYDLALYFKKQIMLKLTPKGPKFPPKSPSSFDEFINTISCSKQVDIHISYYDEKLELE